VEGLGQGQEAAHEVGPRHRAGGAEDELGEAGVEVAVQEAAGVVQEQANKLYTQGKDAVTDAVHRNGRASRTPSESALADSDEEEAWDAHVRRAQFPSSAF